MKPAAILTFILIAGLIWGGFLTIVTTAFRKEGQKAKKG